jgi:hypothetical protein
VAPLRQHNKSLEKATENKGRLLGASSEELANYTAGPPVHSPSTHLDLPCTHPCSAWVMLKAASKGLVNSELALPRVARKLTASESFQFPISPSGRKVSLAHFPTMAFRPVLRLVIPSLPVVLDSL